MKRKIWSVILAVVTVLSLTLALTACGGGSSSAEKIKIGDTREQVVKRLGTPDEDEGGSIVAWYGGEAKTIANRLKKIEEEFLKAMEKGDTAKMNSLLEEELELEMKTANLYFPYTVVLFDGEGHVQEVRYDAVYNELAGTTEKTVKNIKFTEPFYVGDESKPIVFVGGASNGKTAVKIYYNDGSYRSYAQSFVPEKSSDGKYTLSWSDSWGEYQTICDVTVTQDVKKGAVATYTDENNFTWKFTALEDGTYYNPPALSATVTGDGEIVYPASLGSSSLGTNLKNSIIEVTFGNNITSIGRQIFFSCNNLTGVTIENSVTTIGVQAFDYCYHLTSITFRGTMEEWNAISKGNNWIPNSLTIVCTDGTLE